MKMKKTLTLLLACAMAVSMASCGSSSSAGETSSGKEESSSGEAAKAATPKLDGYELLWSDEFDGDKLNEDIWSYDPHEPGWTNNELQEYTTSTDNVFVKDGVLTLKALKTDKNGKDYYTSGKVKSQGKKDFTYGKVTVSAKVPQGQGLWPAIWMMPTDEQHYGQWPKCGEIDIMEVLGNDTKTAYGTVHYGEPHAQQQKDYKLVVGSFAEKFHEYSVEWEPGEMRWYIDGNEYLKVNDWFTAVDGEDEKPYPAPFDQPFFVQLNLAVGGDWPGNPDSTTNFDKAQFEIDYVRVYQKPSYDKNVKKPEVEMRKALEDGNFIYNGDFKEAEDLTDDKNWKFLLFNEGEGSAKIENGEIVITSKKEGTEEYSVQLVQPELPMIKGKKYKVSFEAYAEKPRDMIVCVSAPTAGWIRYLKDTKLSLTTEKKQFTYEFEVTAKTDPNGRLEFNMGKCGSTETIHITNVRVEEIK
ncbi:MAG: family 16 glycosylhydrolase [Ruminococcus sp.]|nr:family 16 glycosylhydrolase [Ruminococcus sp.]